MQQSIQHWELYCDGSASDGGTDIGAGVVVRSPLAGIQAYSDYREGHNLSSLEAEWMAFAMGVSRAPLEEPCVIFTDNRNVFRTFGGKRARPPKRIHDSEYHWDAVTELALRPNAKVALTNATNSSLMALAHTEANKARINKAASATFRKQRRSERMLRVYTDELIREVVVESLRRMGVDTQEDIDRVRGNLDFWIERHSRGAVEDGIQCGHTIFGEDDVEDRILYQRNLHTQGMFQLAWEGLHDIDAFQDDLEELRLLLEKRIITDPLLWCDGTLGPLSGPSRAEFRERVIERVVP